MACADRMEQLSLLDSDQPSSLGPQGDCFNLLPFKQSIVAAKLDGIHTDIVISEFRNRVLIVITQCRKIASFISVSKDIAQEGCGTQQEVYVTRTIFGSQLEEPQELVARFLAEQTNLSKPVVFALGLQDHSPRTVRALATVINSKKSW